VRSDTVCDVTEHLMSWEKDEARWVPRSEEEGDGETGMRGGRRSSGKDKEDGMQMDEKQASEHASEQADDGLPKPGAGNEGQMGADTQGNGSDGSSCQNGHEVQKRDGQSAQDNAGGNGVSAREDGGFEEEEARSPRDAACVVNGRQRGGGGASACGRGEYASTAQAREALEAARTRREKAEREVCLCIRAQFAVVLRRVDESAGPEKVNSDMRARTLPHTYKLAHTCTAAVGV
jgi:hypothetical protein